MILNDILMALLLAALIAFGIGVIVTAVRSRSADRRADAAPMPVATRAVRPPASQAERYHSK